MKTIIQFTFLPILLGGCVSGYNIHSGFDGESDLQEQVRLVSYHPENMTDSTAGSSNGASNSTKLSDYEIYVKNRENEQNNQNDSSLIVTSHLYNQQGNTNDTNDISNNNTNNELAGAADLENGYDNSFYPDLFYDDPWFWDQGLFFGIGFGYGYGLGYGYRNWNNGYNHDHYGNWHNHQEQNPFHNSIYGNSFYYGTRVKKNETPTRPNNPVLNHVRASINYSNVNRSVKQIFTPTYSKPFSQGSNYNNLNYNGIRTNSSLGNNNYINGNSYNPQRNSSYTSPSNYEPNHTNFQRSQMHNVTSGYSNGYHSNGLSGVYHGGNFFGRGSGSGGFSGGGGSHGGGGRR